jgi:hypothetical protein
MGQSGAFALPIHKAVYLPAFAKLFGAFRRVKRKLLSVFIPIIPLVRETVNIGVAQTPVSEGGKLPENLPALPLRGSGQL